MRDLFPNLELYLKQRSENNLYFRYHPELKQDLLAWVRRHLDAGHSLASLCNYL